jgi:hypothetical protein
MRIDDLDEVVPNQCDHPTKDGEDMQMLREGILEPLLTHEERTAEELGHYVIDTTPTDVLISAVLDLTTELDHGAVRKWLTIDGTTITTDDLRLDSEVPLIEAEVAADLDTGDEDGFTTAEPLHTTKSSGSVQPEVAREH